MKTNNAIAIREDLSAAIQRAWDRISQAGTWWNGEQRLEIAAETRHALGCQLCQDRSEALSPNMVQGDHDSRGKLPATVVDCIHRIANDPGRLSEAWYKGLLEQGLSDCEYVETVSVVNMMISLDTFYKAMGLPIQALPAPVAGEPSLHRPCGAKKDSAWVPTLLPEDLSEDDINPYEEFHAYNIQLALGLVPQEVNNFFDLDTTLYLTEDQIGELDVEVRAISRVQMELIASRGASTNGCHYCATCHTLHLHKMAATNGETLDLNGVLTGSTGENGVEHGDLLIAFVDAVLSGQDSDIEEIRKEILVKFGDEGLVDIAGSMASFNSIVRMANATGTQLDPYIVDVLENLNGDKTWLDHVPTSK